MSEHPDVYRGIHKALRRRLFQLCLQAGSLDGAEAYQREALAHAWESLVASLRAHTLHEERFLHPLLTREPGLRAALEDGHETHEQALAALEAAPREALLHGAGGECTRAGTRLLPGTLRLHRGLPRPPGGGGG